MFARRHLERRRREGSDVAIQPMESVAVVAVATVLAMGGASAPAPGSSAPMTVATSQPAGAVRLEGDGLGVVRFGASESAAIRKLEAVLGAPTGRPAAGCGPEYTQAAWHDLVVQFRSGRFTGYRYLPDGKFLTGSSNGLGAPLNPKLATAAGITLGSTWRELKAAYPSLRSSGTNFWSTTPGVVFMIESAASTPPASSRVTEIKDDVCPGAL
jgi:hypothetical protein